MMNILNRLLRSKQTVFSFKEILIITRESNTMSLRKKLHYYIHTGQLYHIRRGLYAKNKDYDRKELATKILTPSYVSFETVLLQEGIIFQYSSQIFVASYTSRTITIDETNYIYRAVKPTILTNSIGIKILDTYCLASAERAYLDMLYIHKDFHFDNEFSLDWKKIFEIVPLYNNKRMKRIVDAHYKALLSIGRMKNDT